jgi:hypothetical protein
MLKWNLSPFVDRPDSQSHCESSGASLAEVFG